MNETGLCCVSPCLIVLWPLRSYFRGKYNRPGSLSKNCLVAFCCLCCTLCQLANEWKSRHSDGVVNQQIRVTTTVIEKVHETQSDNK